MKLRINKLTIKDFRQAGERSFKFKAGQNFIIGANGSGKTNTLHAVTWALFGKDLDDRTKFDAVPLNADNTKSELEPDVTLELSIDGEDHELRRLLKKGRTMQTFIDDAPCGTLKEFDAFVSKIFSSSDRFKMFTNPLFFPEMHWKDQRELFMQFFPMPEAEAVIKHMTDKKHKPKDLIADDLEKLSPEKLQEKLALEQKDIDAKREKIRAQLELLDEQLEGQQLFNDAALTGERKALRESVNKVSAEVKEVSQSNAETSNKKSELERKIFELDFELSNIDAKAQAEIDKERNKLELELNSMTHKRDQFAEDYKNLRAIDTTCPTCGQTLPDDEIAKLEAKLNDRRAQVAEQGQAAAKSILEIKKQLEQGPEEKDTSEEKKQLKQQITSLKQELKQLPDLLPVPQIDDEVLARLDELDKTLARSEVHKENVERRNALLESERELSAAYESCERKLQDLADYFFYRSEMIVNAVNSQFNTISVKVLEIQKNGIPKDTFEITKNGVPFTELNTAGKLQAGIELSEFFKKQFDISCPVLIDNGERYNSRIFSQIDGQLICAMFMDGKQLQVAYELKQGD